MRGKDYNQLVLCSKLNEKWRNDTYSDTGNGNRVDLPKSLMLGESEESTFSLGACTMVSG